MYSPYPPMMDAGLMHFMQQQHMARHSGGPSAPYTMPSGSATASPYMQQPQQYLSSMGSTTPSALRMQHRTPNHGGSYPTHPSSTPGRTMPALNSAAWGTAMHHGGSPAPHSLGMHQQQSVMKPLFPSVTVQQNQHQLHHQQATPSSFSIGGLSSPAPSGSTARRTEQPQQQPNNHNTIEKVPLTANPFSGRGLERDLNLASKEELVQVLLDLSSCNQDAAGFIRTKSQLFALRENCHTQLTHNHTTTNDEACPPSPRQHEHPSSTPSKVLFFPSVDDSTLSSVPSVDASPVARATNNAPGPTPIKTSPGSNREELQQSLQSRHVTPETRAFSTEVHPCLRLYGACRHSTNCIFKSMPRNLCLNWIRGSCAGGSECGCVHRFPPHCPATVEMVYELSRGGDRSGMTSKRAQTLATIVAAKGLVATTSSSERRHDDSNASFGEGDLAANAVCNGPVTERALFSGSADQDATSLCSSVVDNENDQDNDVSSLSLPDADDVMRTPVKTQPPVQRAPTSESLLAAGDDNCVARCLDDSFEEAAYTPQ